MVFQAFTFKQMVSTITITSFYVTNHNISETIYVTRCPKN